MSKLKLSQYEIQDLIERLKKDKNIPEDYKYKKFKRDLTKKHTEMKRNRKRLWIIKNKG